jgi:hypothetical protein
MTSLSANTSPKVWHFASWKTSAWLETIVKSIALLAGFLAFIYASVNHKLVLPSGSVLIIGIILFILSLGLIAAVFDRLQRREITSMIFVIFNNLGHWGMLAALFFIPFPGTYLLVFSGAMLAGDLIKLIEIYKCDLQLPDIPSSVLYGLTSIYALGYATILSITNFG